MVKEVAEDRREVLEGGRFEIVIKMMKRVTASRAMIVGRNQEVARGVQRVGEREMMDRAV